MVKLFQALFDRMFAVAGAVLFSQLPHFFQNYTQRLGGHLEEIKRQLFNLEQAAQKSGKTLPQYIEKFTVNSDQDIALQGEYMQSLISRFSDISRAYDGMALGAPWTRAFHFVQTLQFDIAKLTFNDFSFGLEFTPETGVYALVGMGIGILLFTVVNGILCIAKNGFVFICLSIKHFFLKQHA